jgi:hypothetical protein
VLTSSDEMEDIIEVHAPKGIRIHKRWLSSVEQYEYYVCEGISPANLKVLQTGED